jgi:hypothetical protein
MFTSRNTGWPELGLMAGNRAFDGMYKEEQKFLVYLFDLVQQIKPGVLNLTNQLECSVLLLTVFLEAVILMML